MQNIFEQIFDYHSARDIMIKELAIRNIKTNGKLTITPEKKETRIIYSFSDFPKEKIPDCIKVLKNQIENLRIPTADDNYLCIQALNDNIYDSKNLIDNIKFRFFSRANGRIEITKTGGLTLQEIQATIDLIGLLAANANSNHESSFSSLGVQLFDPQKDRILFDDLAGYFDVKEEILESIIFPLKNPEMFSQISALTRKTPGKNIPRAVLFEGAPGVGKTSFAKAAACQSNIPLLYIPIESILSKFYGESAQRLSMIFDKASELQSCILFLDEIDALVGNRDEGMFEATRNVLSVLLRKLDGFQKQENTILIAATNRKNDLDSALLSRFDRSITFPLPDTATKTAILGIYAKHLTEAERNVIAENLPGFSGRSIHDFCDFVERKWAVAILEQKLSVIPPNFDFYLENVKKL